MVFISYSSADREYANKICKYLESEKLRCWIAPRNIPSGMNYGADIVAAIKKSSEMIVLISKNSLVSKQVEQELYIANSEQVRGLFIYPVFIENIELNNSFSYVLSGKEAFFADMESFNFLKESLLKRRNNDNQRLTFNKKNQNNSSELPRELTNTMVVRSTVQNVLFREKEFANIIDDIQNKQSPNIFLHGMGGCGKTSLARMIYYHLKEQYDCYGWINYSGDIKQSMISDISIHYSNETMIENDAAKKWEAIKLAIKNSTQSKLLVIDNVDNIESIDQHPMQDKELIGMSSWNNITIIITSRLPELSGYDTSYEIKNLGDANDNKKCIELFYHYSPRAAKYHLTNSEAVGKLCALAGYNTMVIELLAKGSLYYSHNLNKYCQKLIDNNFSCANDALVETNHDFTILKTDNSENDYYDVGNETVASQLYKLFNLKTRKPLQQLILWDFHCLRENEKVSIEEVHDWMGFNLKDLSPLIREGWIKQLDDYFFIHPLINQAISCSNETNATYLNIKKNMIADGSCSNRFISSITENTFFSETDCLELSLRKLLFVDRLTYQGDYLSPNDWINIANFARKRGNANLGIYYYKKAYDYYSTLCSSHCNFDLRQYWACTYFYGYMLSYTRLGFKNAERLLKEALELAEQIIQEQGNTDNNLLILATSLDHLGYILSNSLNNDIIRITLADSYLNEAVKLRQILCTAYPGHYRLMHDYAWSLDNLGAFHTNINVENVDFSENPNTNDIYYLTKEEVLKNKKQIKKILKEALGIRINLANAKGDTDSSEVAWTYFNLASLLYKSLIEKNNDTMIDYLNNNLNLAVKQITLNIAEEYIKKALEIYYHLGEKFPGQHLSSEARTLALYGRLLKLYDNRNDQANEYIEKALQLYLVLDDIAPGRYQKEINTLNMAKHIGILEAMRNGL